MTVPNVSGGHGQLFEYLRQNEALWECLLRLPALELPDWYVGAGCIAQTIWNAAHGKEPTADIADYDLLYFDDDLSEEAENMVVARVRHRLADLPIQLDVNNQARVHVWYGSRFGYHIRAYESSSDAIATWPTTATAVGVRYAEGMFTACTPFGTDDLLGLVVRPNRVQITPEIYAAKVARWRQRWPELRVLSWAQGVGIPGIRRASLTCRGI